ncbi:MAG: hypothetical protein ABGY42_00855, partial [bacterium]
LAMALLTAAVVLLPGAASAGSKVQGNLIPSFTDSIGINLPAAKVLAKSKVAVDGKGSIKAVIKLDSKISGDLSLLDKTAPSLSGDELVLVVSTTYLEVGISTQISVPIEVKKGVGKAKASAATLFALMPVHPGNIRVDSINVHEIDATQLAACATLLGSALPAIIVPAPNPCIGANPAVAYMGFQVP